MRWGLFIGVWFAVVVATISHSGANEQQSDFVENALAIFDGDDGSRGDAIDFFVERGNPDAAAALILALRFVADPRIGEALTAITGETTANSWSDWMLW